jgi:ATP-dependent Clp endopeptidase proteolytic subunit ClpP
MEEDTPIDKWLLLPEAKNGYIYLLGRIRSTTSTEIIQKIVELNKLDNIERIRIVIDTPGGSTISGRAIINAMNMSNKAIDTINLNQCASMGVPIFLSATGKRFSFPDATFMVHAPFPRSSYKSKDEMEAQFVTSKNVKIERENADMPEEWFPLTSRERIFSAEEAMKYNVIDEIITELP